MRKVLATAAISFWVLASAAPALAAPRDPFHAPISTTVGTSTSTTTDQTGSNPVPFTPPSDEAPANTGFDATTWLGISYVLIAVGTGMLVLVRQLRPAGAV